jgi:hypothetical protein
MSGVGGDLEDLVALIERLHLPSGLEVTTNEHIYDEHGIQIAEFDVQVKGKVGTTDIRWLIECRDRPSEGPAPGSWIEQLIGRRDRFGFNKVTAVSTTGFAAGALKLARDKGIELREVRSLTAADVSGWLQAEHMPIVQPACRLFNAILYSENEPGERQRAFDETVTTHPNEPILWHVENQKHYTIKDAFRAALSEKKDLFQQVEPDKPARQLTMHVRYPTDNHHFVVNTTFGPVRVREIEFHGELEVKTTEVPLSRLMEYGRSESDEIISQSGAFVFDALGTKLSLGMHKLAQSGEIRLSIRKLDGENQD